MAAPYQWDFDGACAPRETSPGVWEQVRPGFDTFSLGIFQWVPTADGKRVKRGKVVYRIKGSMSDPGAAFESARAYVARRTREQGAHL